MALENLAELTMSNIRYLSNRSQTVHENAMIEMYSRRLADQKVKQWGHYLCLVLGIIMGASAAIIGPYFFSVFITSLLNS